jgi:hypothetical protein
MKLPNKTGARKLAEVSQKVFIPPSAEVHRQENLARICGEQGKVYRNHNPQRLEQLIFAHRKNHLPTDAFIMSWIAFLANLLQARRCRLTAFECNDPDGFREVERQIDPAPSIHP